MKARKPLSSFAIILALFIGAMSWNMTRTADSAAGQAAYSAEKFTDSTAPTNDISSLRRDRSPSNTERTEIGGQPYIVLLDSYALMAEDGTDAVQPLQPAATMDTLADRLMALHPKGNALPILYPEDEPRDALHRQLLTSAVTIELPHGASPEKIAHDTGMRLIEVPDYAPGYAIYEAANPMAALKIAQDWSKAGTLPLVEVQLARQQQLRVAPTLPNDPLFERQWNFFFQEQSMVSEGTDIGVVPVWNYGDEGIRGRGVRIGIVDDGVEVMHPDLASNINTELGYDWNSRDSDPSPLRGNPHGTCCAGLAGARGNNGIGVTGVAPESSIVGMRVVGGRSTDRTEAQAMAHRNDLIAIKSNSWGPDDTRDTLVNAGPLTRAAWQNAVATGRNGKGTIFVWAAGNGGDLGDNSNFDGYANSIHTIAVGGIDSRMRPSFYSEAGSNLVCVAPSDGDFDAEMITTTDRVGTQGYSIDDYADDFGGTSAACPTVAGVVALMLEKNPALGWRDVQEILLRSSTKILPTDPGWSTNGAGLHFHHQFGAGLVNASSAVGLAATWQNLPANAPVISLRQTTASPIPDNSPTGLQRKFTVDANLRVEHVTVNVNIRHSLRGQLSITLTSPTGMVSELAPQRLDRRKNFTNWTFSSVRHWGENSRGEWTLTIRDGVARTSGSLTSAQLNLHGTAAP